MVNAKMGRDTSLIPILCSLVFYLGLWGCYPGSPNSSVELTTVSTGYDKNFNFDVPNYVLIDSIVHIKDEEDSTNNVILDRGFDATIIAAVRRNMNSLGYNEVALDEIIDNKGNPISSGPDVGLVLLLGAVGRHNLVTFYVPWFVGWEWWDGWGCWLGYPGWDWKYPWATGSMVANYRYDAGTLLLSLMDPTNVDPDSMRQNLSWQAGVNGLLHSDISNDGDSFINESIDQAFRQSGYLGRR